MRHSTGTTLSSNWIWLGNTMEGFGEAGNSEGLFWEGLQ